MSLSDDARFVFPTHGSTFALQPGRFRATVRDVARENVVSGSGETGNSRAEAMLSLEKGMVTLSLGDSLLSIGSIRESKPSQRYRYWLDNGTAMLHDDFSSRPADPASTDAEMAWLGGTMAPKSRECPASPGEGLAADVHSLLLQFNGPAFQRWSGRTGAPYMPHIRLAANRYGLPPQLIYAIMRTESAFNPFAVSHAGALGLMQLVPETAGSEVYRFLHGANGTPARNVLFDPRKNIEYGSAYLHLLGSRYFGGITNRSSRELCMIAAYNAGPGAVLRTFSPAGRETALAAINAMRPDQVFARLSRFMPAEETRQYVGKVVAAISTYPG